MNTAAMNVILQMLAEEVGPKEHAVLIMDQAGWHKAKALNVSSNFWVLLLPYSREHNIVERLWAYLRSHYLANRVFDDDPHLLDAGAKT